MTTVQQLIDRCIAHNLSFNTDVSYVQSLEPAFEQKEEIQQAHDEEREAAASDEEISDWFPGFDDQDDEDEDEGDDSDDSKDHDENEEEDNDDDDNERKYPEEDRKDPEESEWMDNCWIQYQVHKQWCEWDEGIQKGIYLILTTPGSRFENPNIITMMELNVALRSVYQRYGGIMGNSSCVSCVSELLKYAWWNLKLVEVSNEPPENAVPLDEVERDPRGRPTLYINRIDPRAQWLEFNDDQKERFKTFVRFHGIPIVEYARLMFGRASAAFCYMEELFNTCVPANVNQRDGDERMPILDRYVQRYG